MRSISVQWAVHLRLDEQPGELEALRLEVPPPGESQGALPGAEVEAQQTVQGLMFNQY
jgi:hypothetical protein